MFLLKIGALELLLAGVIISMILYFFYNSSTDKKNENTDSLNYCSHCGNNVAANAAACMSCGCSPKYGGLFCTSCGVTTNPNQIICINCSVSLTSKVNNNEGDGKTVAILAYISLIGFIIAIVQHTSNKSKLGAYHLRQALGIMLTSAVFAIVMIILIVPMASMGYGEAANYASSISSISILVSIVLLICVIQGLFNAANAVEKPMPIFGKLYEKWFGNIFL